MSIRHSLKLLSGLTLTTALLFSAEETAPAAPSPAALVNIAAIMRPQAGKADELRASLLALHRPTHEEPGCLVYAIHESADGVLFLYEVWRSRADFEAHIAKPYTQGFIRKSGALLDGANEVHFGKLVSGTDDGAALRDRATPETVNIVSVKTPRPGRAAELRDALLALEAATKREPGCLGYNIHEEENGTVFLYEVWRSREDLELHFQKPYIRDFREKVGGLAERNEIHLGRLLLPPR